METASNVPNIRPARVADVELLRQIDLECFGTSAVPLAQFQWLLTGQGENPVFEIRVSTDEEAITGFVCWRTRLDSEGKTSYEILDLSVGKKFRDESIEHRLVDRVVEEATKAVALGVTVNVPHSNIAATAFYLKCGFQIAQTVAKYYDDGTSMDMMVRRLR